MSKPTEASFLSDVAEHRMEVLRDDGVYRHLRFKKPRSCDMQFELLTYPGALCYSGDMGSYVFERLPDMFEFFRTGLRDPGRLAVNLSYWSEKIVAADRDGVRKYSAKLFEDAVREVTDAYIGEYGLPDGCPQEAWSESLQILLASADTASSGAATRSCGASAGMTPRA